MIKGNDSKSFDAMSFLGAVIVGDRKTILSTLDLFTQEEKRELAKLCHDAARIAAPQIACSELLKERQ